MPKYKSHDILNHHRSRENTHPEIQSIKPSHPDEYNTAIVTRNMEKILEITYEALLRNCPGIAGHMQYMESDGGKTGIVIFEKQIYSTTHGIDKILNSHTSRYSTSTLDAVILRPTDDAVCGLVDPEILMKSHTVIIHGTKFEWDDSIYTDSSGKVVPVLYHVTSADRWGVIIQNLAKIYPSTFSNYYRQFLDKYPQTDISVDCYDRATLIACITFVCFFYAVLVWCV